MAGISRRNSGALKGGMEPMQTDYEAFLLKKSVLNEQSGFEVDMNRLNPGLFAWQKATIRWAVFKGRAALFEDCGLGKTIQQLEWARIIHEKTGGDIIILTPLAVADQTYREGLKFGIASNLCRSENDRKNGINITNYERIHKFDMSRFVGVVLDESSILKNFSGKIRNQIISEFIRTPYRLCCTATPSPNDYAELGNTSEFLGVMTRPEMLSMFFINDTGKVGTWRLKGHVKANLFWEWMCSWSIMMQKPSDIGYPDDDEGFVLPELRMYQHVVPYDGPVHGLFVDEALTLSERREARKVSIEKRCALAANLINNIKEESIVWCNLNAESKLLSEMIDGAVEITGSDSADHKELSMVDFSNGKIKALVTKPKIAGFGMNWQNCHNVFFVGISDSYEQYYQAVRRCWRFGQKIPVNAHIIISEREGAVLRNIQHKEQLMQDMFSGIVENVSGILMAELKRHRRTQTIYDPKVEMVLPKFLTEDIK
jgi:hypothetical protein